MRYRLKRGDVLDIKSLRKVASVLYKATPSQYYEIEKLQLWVNTQTCIKSSTLRDNVITKHLPDMISEGVDTFYVQRLRRIHKRKNKSAVSLYFWVLKYGKSKGVYLYKQYNKSRKVTLEDSIRRYGEDVGRKKYNDYVNKQKKNGVTLEWFQEQYGMIEGLAKYKDIGRRKAHTISSYIERYGNEEEALYKLSLFWSKRNTGRFFSDSSQRLCRDVDNLHIFDSYFATKNVEYGIYDNIMHRYFMYDYTIPHNFFANDILVHNSMYIKLSPLVDSVFKDQKDVDKIVKFLDKACEDKIEPFIDKCYEELSVYVNAYEQKMKMKREAIANKGIWTGKKHYILNVYNLEGVQYKEPKLKMQGIEAVRSSTPSACREYIKDALKIIIDSTEEDLVRFIDGKRVEFKTKPFEEIAFPRSVKDMNKYYDSKAGYRKISKSGVPIHVRAALLYNHLLKKKNLDTVLNPIYEGDKIKFAYMMIPNPVFENVIAAPGRLPKQLGLDRFIDYDTQFDKAFVEPIKTIVNVMGWRTERASSTLEDFFGE
ncbi:hypothetical protein EB118_20530 [bacterium]|nr:hypothetical protein [bacterium]